MEHPFEDGAKLRILNAKFSLPEVDKEYGIFHGLICMYCILYYLNFCNVQAIMCALVIKYGSLLCLSLLVIASKAGFWGEVRGGGTLIAPLLKFSAPPLRTFTPPLIILIV